MRAILLVSGVLLMTLGGSVAWAASPVAPVADAALREAAIQAVFAGMKVSREAGKSAHEVSSKPDPERISRPDALAGEAVYRVEGRATNEAERCAAEDMVTQRFSEVRQVRTRVFRWPGRAATELLVVVQYAFEGASPGGFCWSLGLLAHVVQRAGVWERREQYLLETQHHDAIQRAELLDLDESGVPMLVVESGVGGAMVAASTLQVFRLKAGRFEELLNEYSRMEYDLEEGYTQDLDPEGTKAERRKGFRLVKRTYWENARRWTEPRVSDQFRGYGFGVKRRDVRTRQRLLRPLK